MAKRILILFAVVLVFSSISSSLALAQSGVSCSLAVAPSGGGGAARRKENLDLPFEALGVNQDDEDAPEVIIFCGQNFEGDGIFYCLDRSGSTADGELNREKQSVVKSINDLSDHVQFGIVFYNGDVSKHPANGRPDEANPSGKSAAIRFVMSQQPGSGSCAGKGIVECIRMANRSSAKRNIIIYVGDGCTMCPGHDDRQYAKQALAEIAAMNFKHHQINSIVGCLEKSCDYWAKPLADMNGGTYRAMGE